MANKQNLRPFTSDQSREEAAKNGKKGGINSGVARREKANLKKLIQTWLESDSGVTDKNGEKLTGAEFMLKVAVKEMAKGNSKYWELLRDTSGQKPVEKVMVADVDSAVIDEIEREVLGDDEANDG